MTKTPPPFARASSGDWSGQNRTPPGRPHSRGASTYLGSGPSGGATLTAKEQMTVAKVTGSPLINMASNGRKEEEQAPGLVGALAARQREKAAMAQGIRSGMVQHAIAARQQQQMQLEAEAQAQAQLEMQQRAQQQAQAQQYQQAAYQQAMMNQQASMIYQQQQQAMASQMQYGQSMGPGTGHGRQNSMQMANVQQQGYNMPQQNTRVGGFGGQFAQQQGMMSPSQQQAHRGSYYGSQSAQQWQQPRR